MTRSKQHKRNATKSRTVEEDYNREWFEQNSREAGAVLRKLRARSCTRRLDFLDELYDFMNRDDVTDQYMDGLYEGGLPQVLLDITMERHLYSRCYEGYNWVSISHGIYSCQAETLT